MESSNLVLTWKNLTVEVTEKQPKFWKTTKSKKIILHNVSGMTKSGALIAIMGPSGAGKSTLLNALSGKLKVKYGEVKLNNTNVNNEKMKFISGFTLQEDMFTETLTVYEHMQFMTALKLDKLKENSAIIKKIIADLSLEEHKEKRINVLSSGERKRLSLATELINDPYILFCDEPTTALDSFSAMTVVQKLENLAQSGKIVLITVHQPSSQLYNYFDDIILLAQGQLIFHGSKKETQQFFQRANLFIPESYNPADFYMQSITSERFKKQYLKLLSLSSVYEEEMLNSIKNYCNKTEPNGVIKNTKLKRSVFYEFRWLFWRNALSGKRNLSLHLSKTFLLVITAFIIGICYSSVHIQDKNSVQNIQGVLLFMVTELIFTHMYAVIYTFPEELHIFIKENGLYSCWSYFLAKIIFMIPGALINSFFYLSVNFICLPFLQSVSLFANMYYVLALSCIVASAFGLCLSALFTSLEYIDMFIVPLEFLCMTMSGIWIKLDTIPKIFRWLKYFSAFYFSYESLTIFQWKNVSYLNDCNMTKVLPCYENGQKVLEQFGFFTTLQGVFIDILGLCALFIFYCLIGFWGVFRKRKVS